MDEKELTKESVRIPNDPKYSYVLHCDDIAGIIRMSYKTARGKTMTITSKCVPITMDVKHRFTEVRTGYSSTDPADNPDFNLGFTGSVLLKDKNPDTYKKVKK
jgi:hypothetical protein